MAKSSKAPVKTSGPDLRELIVITKDDAGWRASRNAVASVTGKKVSSMNTLLKQYNVNFVPIFGTENRAPKLSSAAIAALSSQHNIILPNYYKVDATANLDALRKALLNEPTVEAAYIKPMAEPPVMNDQRIDFDKVAAADTPPSTPSFVARQLYLNAAPGGIDAAYASLLAGGKGNGVRIIDVEGAWRYSHEDLLANQGGVIGGTQSTDIGWRNHGTAVNGEFGGDDNTFGITGICPNANVRAISIFGTGMSSSVAVRQAADALGAGDIILIELHRPGPRFGYASRTDELGYIAVEWWPDDFAAIRYAIAKNILVVEPAGNGAENFDDPLYNTRPSNFPSTWTNPFNMANPQSGAIVVGAGAPPSGTHGRDWGVDRSKLDFSNYGARVDAQGWGREVTTCGYGDLQGGVNEDLWYTDTFSGTSSASPIIVGALGSIQGRLKARSKPALTPATAQNLLRTTGSPQQAGATAPISQRIGNRPNLRQAFDNLGIGGKVLIKEIKDKDKDKDFKETKEHKEIVKDVKDKDIKDVKEKEHKEIIKEVKDKDIKDIKEKDLRDVIVHPVRQGDGGPANTEDRLSQLEQTVQQLAHFIPQEYRPDLQTGLFQQGDDLQQTQDDLQKNASDAKNAKDNKDMEKLREL